MTEHVKAIAEYLVSHTGGSVQIPSRQTGKGVSFNDGMSVGLEHLQALAKFYLLRHRIKAVVETALAHTPLGSDEERAARELLGEI